MGHIRFGKMPKTRSWVQVVQLLSDDGADISSIAASIIGAASRAFDDLAKDAGLQSAFWALTQVTLRARDQDFVSALTKAGIDISGISDHFQLISKVSKYVRDKIQASGKESVFSEMARLSLASVLTRRLAPETLTLFGTSIEDVRLSLKRLSTRKNFAALSRDYFAEVLCRCIKYFATMEICNHVGPSARLKDVDSLSDFDAALRVHCQERARIVEEFSGGWYTKTEYEKGIGPEEAKGFIYVALDKLRQEISERGTEQ